MFMNSAATTEISALSLHDALPILHEKAVAAVDHFIAGTGIAAGEELDELVGAGAADDARSVESVAPRQRLAQLDRARSEEHTSELQSRRDHVCRHLLAKKQSLRTQ